MIHRSYKGMEVEFVEAEAAAAAPDPEPTPSPVELAPDPVAPSADPAPSESSAPPVAPARPAPKARAKAKARAPRAVKAKAPPAPVEEVDLRSQPVEDAPEAPLWRSHIDLMPTIDAYLGRWYEAQQHRERQVALDCINSCRIK